MRGVRAMRGVRRLPAIACVNARRIEWIRLACVAFVAANCGVDGIRGIRRTFMASRACVTCDGMRGTWQDRRRGMHGVLAVRLA